MSKIIIGIHGLGNKPPKDLCEKWWKKSIQEGINSIGKRYFNIKFEMVYWADILHPTPLDPSEKNKDHRLFIAEPYIPSPPDIKKESTKLRKKILDYVEKQLDKLFLNSNKTINLTKISDMIIHNYFKDLETYYSNTFISDGKSNKLVRDIIRDRLYQALMKYKNRRILLIAHSMGTIITYDVLSRYNQDFAIDTLITIGSPLGIPIIIKKIAAEQKVDLKKRRKLKTPENVSRYWYNFSDLHDKVAFNYNLGDDYSKNSNHIKALDKTVFNDYVIGGERNPHKAYGYLRTPELAEVVYDFLTRDKSKLSLWFNTKFAKLFNKFF